MRTTTGSTRSVQYENELDPALHYCRIGWRSALRPNTAFAADWYAETNPMVMRLRINPLTHYLLEGEPANRRPVLPWFDPALVPVRLPGAAGATGVGTLSAASSVRASHVSPDPLFDVNWVCCALRHLDPARDRSVFALYCLRGVARCRPIAAIWHTFVAAPAHGTVGRRWSVRTAGCRTQSVGASPAASVSRHPAKRLTSGRLHGHGCDRAPLRPHGFDDISAAAMEPAPYVSA